MNRDELLHSFQKNSSGDEVRFTLIEKNGHYYIDMRIWSDYAGDGHRPLKQGIRFHSEAWPEFLAGIEKLTARLEQ